MSEGKEHLGLETSSQLKASSIHGERREGEVSNGVNEDHEFDPSAPPPFRLAEVRAVIPKHCWVKDPWKSMSYVLRDCILIFGLAIAAIYLDRWVIWPLYWAVQGTMFWALFVLGHDCGHGSFSDNPMLNSIVGHLLHSAILVPYNGWRISHRTHHQNQGHVEKDESWVPFPEKLYRSLDSTTRTLRFKLPFPLLAYPLYLVYRSPGKEGSHFNPYSCIFPISERKGVLASTLCWSIMVALLVVLSFSAGPILVFKLYGVPYWVFIVWLDFVTYLQHHGYDKKLPWYRDEEWSHLRGGLTTVDRDYGWLSGIQHNPGTHVLHHLFPQIPHYHLIEATEAAKPVLGAYYREPKKSGPIPVHLVRALVKSMKEDHYVSNTGGIVYYQTDPQLFPSHHTKPE